MRKLNRFLSELVKEPPIRLFAAAFVKRFSRSLQMQALWDAWPRPHYLAGVLWGAGQARKEGIDRICVIEFGVANGDGLLELQDVAAAVETETGVAISVFGFDLGTGLPTLDVDYRDHPDKWQGGDFPLIDRERLQTRLAGRSTLILGDVKETVVDFVLNRQPAPVGFIAFDLDLYTATRDAMQVLSHPQKKTLRQVPLYFDDTLMFEAHRFAGERLAIEEFNSENTDVKIDRWPVLKFGRPFFDRQWLEGMYVAHDLRAVSQAAREKRSTRYHATGTPSDHSLAQTARHA